MFSKNVTIYLEKEDDMVNIEAIGDTHVGHSGFQKSHYEKTVKRIASKKDRYTLFMGDMIDAINEYDKRWNRDAVFLHDLDDQYNQWLQLTEPILKEQRSRCKPHNFKQAVYNPKSKEMEEIVKEGLILKKGESPKVFGFLHGNHETKLKQLGRTYLENNICFPNGLDFLGYKAYIMLDIKYKNKLLGSWDIMAMHGSGGGKPETMLQQMKQNNYMDIFMCGHLHQKTYKPETVYVPNKTRTKIAERTIHLINTGTFCDTSTEGVSGYMDTKNQVIGVPTGTATLSINAYTGDINGHI